MDSGEPHRADPARLSAQARAQATGAPLGLPGAAPSRSLAGALARSLRLQQWAKNILIFVPLVLGGKVQSVEAWSACLLGFIAFGLLASATYLVNDLRDLPFDRLHWSKSARPLANGDLPITLALVAIPVGVVASFAIALSIDLAAALVLLVYGALTLTYSFRLKRLPILDVLALAVLFTLRIVFGIYLAKVAASPWLLVFSMFLFTSLSLAKRHTEVRGSGARGREHVNGRGYLAGDGPLLMGLGLASAVAAVLIMVLYLINEAFGAGFYRSPMVLWSTPAILFFWLSHVWLLAGRDRLDDDPLHFAITDRTSLVCGGLMVAAFIGAWQL
jgi:4-hydroxybenzoate polyprenyltransferase